MRLAVSNIAWRPGERDQVHSMLAEMGVRGLEIAPGLTFPDEPDPFAPSADAVSAFHRDLERNGLTPVSMQSLLFGVKDAALFGSEAQRTAFVTGLERAIDLAGRLGIPNLVMGSPTNRVVPEGMDHAAALNIARDVFRRLGDRCATAGCRMALEPNPVAYGANFMTTIGEAAEVAGVIDHPGISVNFDLGSLHMNGEIGDAAAWYDRCDGRVSHVHISEPNLEPAPRDVAGLSEIREALSSRGYAHWWSVEMRQVGESNLDNVRRAMQACVKALSTTETAS